MNNTDHLKLTISKDFIRVHPKHASRPEPVLVLAYWRGILLEKDKRIRAAQQRDNRPINEAETSQLQYATDRVYTQCVFDLGNIGVDDRMAKELSKLICGTYSDMMLAVEQAEIYVDINPRLFRRPTVVQEDVPV